MNTISIHAEMDTTSLGVGRTFSLSEPTAPRRRAPVAWLPVPKSPQVQAIEIRRSAKPVTLRIHPYHSLPGEKFLMALLALAAAIGVAYGFSCLVDLVQNWALFGAGVGRLIQ
ncbi:MAG TPA: hypothetical protein VNZ64_18910 [Candidatus Acidoferrum sp.]|jgi:hypothetical protein|nr:hypothetical protein [Candidatus Acidoferrum sp.]